MAPQPTGLIAKKGIELITGPTPNGYKASILLEELKDAYGLEYTWQYLDISTNTQKEPWFIKLSPNGRIPAIHDHDRDISVMEGAAILQYLTRHFDPEHKFAFVEEPYITDQEIWISWQHGGLGPMQGQAGHFFRYAKDRDHYGIQRYVGEAERLYGILDTRLKDRDFIVGPGRGTYSIADIASIGWTNGSRSSGLDITKFPNVKAWFDRCYARPATKRGFEIPFEAPFYLNKYDKHVKDHPDVKEKEDKLHSHLQQAQKEYDYKYTSP